MLLIQRIPSIHQTNSTSLHEAQGLQAKTFMAAAAAAVTTGVEKREGGRKGGRVAG